MTRRTAEFSRLGLVLPLLAVSCQGSIIGGSDGASSAIPGVTGVGPGGVAGGSAGPAVTGAASCQEGTTRGAAKESVRRLTREELRATLADLLPNAAAKLSADIDDIQDRVLVDEIQTFTPLFTQAQISGWLALGDKLGALLASDASALGELSSDACLSQSPIAASCWEGALRGFLPRLFRRPVTNEEVSELAGYGATGDRTAGTQALVTRLFMSPDFLFHIETGTTVEATRIRLSDHEVANRVAYGTVGSLPDQELRAAADAGKLQTLPEVEAQVRRLLLSPRAHGNLGRFFGEWMQVEGVSSPDPGVYNEWAKLPGDVASAKADLTREVYDFVDGVVWQEQGTFHDLVSKPSSYTQSPFLQAVYGASGAVTQGTAYATPNHPGLFLRAGMLTSSGGSTNPIRRGVRFLKRVLCEELPPPDPSIIATRLSQLDAIDPLNTPNFERVAKVTAGDACQGCHVKINPVGFLLEEYDQLGRKRTEETFIDTIAGEQRAIQHPLPTGAETFTLSDGVPQSYQNALEFVGALTENASVRTCMSRYFLRHLDRRREGDLDQCAIEDTAAALGQDQPVAEAFVKGIANQDIFWRRL